jgi:uncharacterized protein (TIGR02118 family)
MLKLLVLYPQPTDVQQFEIDYVNHLDLLHEKAGIPADVKPYTVTKMLPTPEGTPPFYQLFSLPFESLEALQAAMSSEAMQEVGADAARISTGGAPVILIGNEA